MAVLRESPWYQEILQEGEARGRQEELLSNIEMSLEVKFGSLGVELMSQIRPISDLERLKDILRHIIATNTVEELQQIL